MSIPRAVGRGVLAVVVLAVAVAALVPQLSEAQDALGAAGGVAWWLIVAGSALQATAILCQAMLIRSLIPVSSRPSRLLAVRIELASTFASHTIPGGTVAGTALGFQLLRTAGVRGADAGFAAGVRGFGSALVLNVLLCATLLVSIPLHGFSPTYTVMAGAGVGLLAAVGVVLALLVREEEQIGEWLGRVLSPIPGVAHDDVDSVVAQLADRARTLVADRSLLTTVAGWSAGYWLFGAASLWVFLAAFGDMMRPDETMVAFGIANIASFIPLTPRGLGVVEVTLVSVLTGFGVPGGQAVLGVLAWRMVAFWAPIPLGGATYLSLTIGPTRAGAGREEEPGPGEASEPSEASGAKASGS